jgi:hypothetical protein
VGKTLWIEQLKAVGLTLALAVVGTGVIASIIKATIGLRPDADGEEEGLDLLDHGEAGYHFGEAGGAAARDGDETLPGASGHGAAAHAPAAGGE